jgi:hypothetical protein
MSHCLVCQKPIGLERVTVGMLWWARSYCSEACADEDAKQIQQEELKKQHDKLLHPKPP